MHELVDELRKTHALTVIIVSHLPHEVARIADSLAFMLGGKILKAGPADAMLSHPENPELARYLRFTSAG